MRRSVVVVAGLLVLTGCRDSKPNDDGGRTTLPTASSSTSTTAVSYDVPATIDVAYIEKVMAALDHVYGEAARYMAKHKTIDEEFSRYLVALHGGDSLDLERQIWAQVVAADFQLLRPNPGDARTTVERLIIAHPNCVLFQVKRDFSEIFKEPDPLGPPRFIGLVPLPPDRDTQKLNPTPWIMTFDGQFKDGAEPTPEEACTNA